MLSIDLDRRAVLIELARAGMLTRERSDYVRSHAPEHVREQILAWNAPPGVRRAAGLELVRTSAGAHMPPEEVQRQVDMHMAALGLNPAPVLYVTEEEATSYRVSFDWDWPMRQLRLNWTYPNLAPRVAKILLMADDKAWQPLVRLIEHNIHPHGLVASPPHRYFIVVDAST